MRLPPSRLGLRAQVLLGLAAIVLFAAVSIGWLATWVLRRSLEAWDEDDARGLAQSLAAVVAAVHDPQQPLDGAQSRIRLRDAFAPLLREGVLSEALILDHRLHGLRLVPGAETTTRLPSDPLAVLALAGGGTLVQRLAEAPESAFPAGVMPGRAAAGGGDRPAGPGRPSDLLVHQQVTLASGPPLLLRLTVSPSGNRNLALGRSRLLLFGLIAADGLLLLVFGGAVLTVAVLRPLGELGRAAQRIADGNLEQEVAPSGPGEMGSLADSFNRMTAALRQQRRQLAEQIAELEHRGRELAAWREQLVRSEKLASVGRLAAGVAHEIGNPLGAVLGYVEMLLHPGATAVPAEETRDYLQRIQQETTRIHRTIQELLTFARPPRAELEPVDLGRAADTALSLVAVQRRFREVTVARELPADLPTVAGNGSRIVQVLVNLLLNAADAMDGQGIVRLRTRREAEHLLLEITDGGPGVAEADRARVFDPFFTTKGPGEGTGLGLSTSQSIVEALGGSLDLAAAVAGEGATFVVRLPLWRERPLAAQDDAEA